MRLLPKHRAAGGVGLAPACCAYVDAELDDSSVVGMLTAAGLHVSREWVEFRSNGLDVADAAICVILGLKGPVWSDLLRFVTGDTHLTFMLITEYTRDNARAFAHVKVDELLFIDEVSETALHRRIASMTSRRITRIAAAALREHAMGLDSELAETLARACTTQSLVRSVHDLVGIMGYSRSEFTRRWEQCTPAGSQPHHFVEWLRLMHALLLRRRTGDSWTKVAEALGVKPQTLADTCKRRFGVTLKELVNSDQYRLLATLTHIVGSAQVRDHQVQSLSQKRHMRSVSGVA